LAVVLQTLASKDVSTKKEWYPSLKQAKELSLLGGPMRIENRELEYDIGFSVIEQGHPRDLESGT